MAVSSGMTMSETGYDIANNYSLVYVKITCTVSGSSYNNNTQSGTFTFEGQTYSYSYKLPKNTTTTVYENTFTVYHDAQGRKTVAGSYSFPTTPAGGTKTGSQTLVLTDIPRQANITGATDFNDEGFPYMEFNNSGGLPINVRLEFGGTEIRRDDVANTGNHTFNLSEAERNLLRSRCTSNSMSVRYTVATKIDGVEKFWSWVDRTMTIVNANPIFSADNVSYKDTNTSVTNITGDNQKIVQNKSNVEVSYAAATALKGATITRYDFQLNGVNLSNAAAGGTVNFGLVNSGNDLTLICIAVDSRGNKTTVTKTIKMLAHSDPNAIVTLHRLNNYEDETYLTVDSSISSVDNKNTMEIKYRYKLSGGEYNDFTTIDDNVRQVLSLDKNNAYIFNILITDAFGGRYDKDFTLGKGVFPLFIDTKLNSVGVNCFPTKEKSFEVAGTYILNSQEIIMYDVVDEW